MSGLPSDENTGLKGVRRGLLELSTMSNGSTYIFTAQEILNKSHFLFASDKRGGLNRQVVRVRAERFEERKVSREVCNDELKEVAGML